MARRPAERHPEEGRGEVTGKPGMETITRFIEDGKEKSQGEVCYDIANEMWIRITTLNNDAQKPQSKRMRKTDRDRHMFELGALKVALRLALGTPRMYGDSNIDAFLNAFQGERLMRAREENA